ncbi:MAG: hypothetical protein H7Z16_01225 [Pyrinomonadaceae bacterium]|nr:hypothetical protein [Pyrinomonadaceae bacterium]
MKRSLFLIAILLLLGFAVPASNAQQTSTPDDGSVDKGVYSNMFFGFSVAYPKDWVVHGEATNTRLKEIGKERATSTGAMSAASTEVILKNTYQLLTAFQYPMGAVVEVNPSFMLIAERVSHAPGIVTGRDYLLYVRPLMIKTGVLPVNDEPAPLMLGGRKFFRQDSRMQINGMSLDQSIIITVNQGFAIAFILSGKDRPSIDEMFKAVGTLKFVASPSASPRKPSPRLPRSKSKPRRRT